jgi:hypothetical protein
VYQRYSEELQRQGQTAPNPMFNTAPNAFVVTMTNGLKRGRSLDVGMGQARNTIYLARHGWDSVAFDPADRAVAAANDAAKKHGVKITTHVARAEAFDWGEAAWDLTRHRRGGIHAATLVSWMRSRFFRVCGRERQWPHGTLRNRELDAQQSDSSP